MENIHGKKSGPLISFPISRGKYQDLVDEIVDLSNSKGSSCVYMANVHMSITAYRDKGYASLINKAEIVTPDGIPLTWALRLLYGVRQERICGMDILPDLIRKAESLQIPVFFYGGTEDILTKTRVYLEKNYPLLIIAGIHSPPFRSMSLQEENLIMQTIHESGAKMVFVVLGCPKQEKWIASMKDKVNATMIGIGGALPVFVGLQKRAPHWMQKYGLEWFFRLLQEPRRLFKRYLFTNSLFIVLILREVVRVRILNKPARFMQD